MNNLDTDIDNWSVEDILELLGLDNPTSEEIINTSNKLIKNSQNKKNDVLSKFLVKARDKVLSSTEDEEDEDSYSEQASNQLLDWRENQYLTQGNTIQSDKVTSRYNKVDIFNDNDKAIMKRQQLGVTQAYDVPVMQGTINPNQRNIVDKTVVIDSQYRSNLFPYAGCDISQSSFNTNFSLDLSESITNVLSMKLDSISLPKTWYNVADYLGNNFFYVDNNLVSIDNGYYTINSLIEEINAVASITLSYKKNSNKIEITSTAATTITWYSQDLNITSNCNCINTNFINNSLGWTLGFRQVNDSEDVSSVDIEAGGSVESDAAPNIFGAQYFLLGVDDYQNNRVNSAVAGIGKINTKLDLPSYTSSDNLSCDGSGNAIYVKTAPRRLTQAQLYTINEINENRSESKVRPTAPTSNNILAVIPINTDTRITETLDSSLNVVNTIIKNDSMLTHMGIFTSRDYFGPVDIERLNISLYDDKGNLVNLNGADWSFTLKFKQLYQY